MSRLPCNASNTMLENDLEVAAQQETISKIRVMEVPGGFYVIVNLLWAKDREWYLATRRNRTSPRLYKDLSRLNDQLKELGPNVGFELVRNQEMPPETSSATDLHIDVYEN